MRRRWPALLGVALAPAALSGCIQVTSLGSDLVACSEGEPVPA